MLSKLLGKKKKNDSEEEKDKTELLNKISKMNITEMRTYVNNKIETLPINKDGLVAVIERFTTVDKKTKLHYIKVDDTDAKKKKAFDLIILIGKNRNITLAVVENIQKFLNIYKDIITAFDTEYKEIYATRLNDVITLALGNIKEINALKNKMNLLGED